VSENETSSFFSPQKIQQNACLKIKLAEDNSTLFFLDFNLRFILVEKNLSFFLFFRFKISCSFGSQPSFECCSPCVGQGQKRSAL